MNNIKVFSALGYSLSPTTPSRCKRMLKSKEASVVWINGEFCVRMNRILPIDKEKVMQLTKEEMYSAFGLTTTNPVANLFTYEIRSALEGDNVARSVVKFIDATKVDCVALYKDEKEEYQLIEDIEKYVKTKNIDVDELIDSGSGGKRVLAYVIARRGAVPETIYEDYIYNGGKISLEDLYEKYSSGVIFIPTFEIAAHPTMRIEALIRNSGKKDLLEWSKKSANSIRREVEINVFNALSTSKNVIKKDNLAFEDLEKAFLRVKDPKNIMLGFVQYEELRKQNFSNNISMPEIKEIDDSYFRDDDRDYFRGVNVGDFYGAKFQILPYNLNKIVVSGSREKVGALVQKCEPMSFIENEYKKLRVGVICTVSVGICCDDKNIEIIEISK